MCCSGFGCLAVRFGADLLNHLLEPLKTKLWSEDWLQRESGILALGAMAEGAHDFAGGGDPPLTVLPGCIDAIEPHLPTLVPYLINTLNDSKVRHVAFRLKRGSLYLPSLLCGLSHAGP